MLKHPVSPSIARDSSKKETIVRPRVSAVTATSVALITRRLAGSVDSDVLLAVSLKEQTQSST